MSFLAENCEKRLGIAPKDLKIVFIDEDGSLRHPAGRPALGEEANSASTPDLSSLVTKLKRAHRTVKPHP